jgi:hypothetical protein
MKNFIILLFLITLFPHDIYSMKRAAPNELTKLEETKKPCIITQPAQPFLPIELVGKIFLEYFKTNIPTRENITTFCLINKKLCLYINRPTNTRTILHNDNSCIYKHIRASFIGTPAMENYLTQTQKLHDQINDLSIEDIKKLIIHHGADVNYDVRYVGDGNEQQKNPPLLSKTINDYNKTECLVELGADPYLVNLLDKNCAFTEAIKKEKIDFVNLFIKYYPYYRVIQFCDLFRTVVGESSVDLALDTKNIELIKSVLKQKNIPYNKLQQVLFYANKEDITDLSELLHNQGVRLSGEIGII